MWPFKRQPLLDLETARWHVDNACWFLRSRVRAGRHEPRLILPRAGFYKADNATGDDLAQAIFRQTKAYAGVADWPVGLSDSYDINDETPLVDTAEKPDILYISGDESDPLRLIPVIVRGLARRLIASIAEAPPCAADEHKALTDLVSCLLGFGVFLADTAIKLRSGASVRLATIDYVPDENCGLSEIELVFDLALFLTTYDLPDDEVRHNLNTSLIGFFKEAMEDAKAYRHELQLARDGF